MNTLDIVGAAFGILGRVAEGVSQAIAAARAEREDEAFDILERAIADTAQGIQSMRARLAKNKADAEKALEEKFDAGEP